MQHANEVVNAGYDWLTEPQIVGVMTFSSYDHKSQGPD